jgi:hypothetical protein
MKIKDIVLFFFILLTAVTASASSNYLATNRSSCSDYDLLRNAVMSTVSKNQGVLEHIHHACFNSEKSKIIIQARTGTNYEIETLYLAQVDLHTCTVKGLAAVDAPLPADFGRNSPYQNWDFSSVINCRPYTFQESANDSAFSSEQQDFGAVQ